MDDLAWVGQDGAGDTAKFIAGHGYDQETTLQLIVRAIIKANPARGQLDLDREKAAIAALTGKSRRGRPETDD